MSLIYIASPYSAKHADPDRKFAIEEKRALDAADVAVQLSVQRGKNELVFVPVAYGHTMRKVARAQGTDFKGDAATWWEFNRAFLCACSCVYVLKIEGWNKSLGIQQEIAFAKKINKPIYYVEVDVPAEGSLVLGTETQH